MTTNRAPLARTELAGLLSDAAQSVSEILTAEYPTAASRSYLHPVLGVLSAGPRVVRELNDRFEGFLAAEPVPATPAGLFTLASYASALGWLTESLAELTTSVDRICTRVGMPTAPPDPAFTTQAGGEQETEFDFAFSALEMGAIRTAAEAAGLTPGDYIGVLSESLLAASRITDACMEISSGLLEDAAYVLGEATDQVWIGDGPDSLPTLVRSLLARMEAAE
ncbi:MULTISPECIES: hypothetical protein [Streptomycetaceae]|uniref:Uncharacterized protein n=1 Tax=Streptantibioticus cattleyicolor (strain ATCC 35852 / DSM 46488 / JCM 4925 / NBRC 14057 / NRRL 8057) TaxID=1003195 RepID=F8K4J0_STREN|nr:MULTISPECIES: hypothetical protein [Streptomycetaceae]AEW95143.1 hypothetical protein SCATT_27720 [Streptantibioticus cattleyicolor NRRL 8057 = DSM 46488]MYS59729.1 hypothetical protein [Streptomyces sp. SID5468]CCB75491.1 conserved protein of unknown function [Streptantibioticus cattleyicolor NRRL 8057 = DSM 46488]